MGTGISHQDWAGSVLKVDTPLSPTADSVFISVANRVWDPIGLTWVTETQPGGGGGGTQYTDGVTQATPVGTVALGKNPSNILHAIGLSAAGNLNVNLAEGTISGGNAAASPTGSPVPASADYTGWNSGGNLVGTSLATALPVQPGTGAVWSVSQSGVWSTGRTWALGSGSDSVAAVQSGAWTMGRTWTLSSVGDSVAAVQSGTWSTGRTWALSSGTDSVTVTGSVSVNTITNFALETGGNLAAINTKIPAQGAALTTASLPVNIASDQIVPVSASSLPLPTNAAQEQSGNLSLIAGLERARNILLSQQLALTQSMFGGAGFVPIEVPSFLGG